MGLCCCKQSNGGNEAHLPNNSQECAPSREYSSSSSYRDDTFNTTPSQLSSVLDELVLEVLNVITYVAENVIEQSAPLLTVHGIAEREGGWIQVVASMVKVIPMDDPLGPLVITVILEDCPLPSKESVAMISTYFNLNAERALNPDINVTLERNIFIILGGIAERLAGPNSIAMLTENTLEYIITYLKHSKDGNSVLFALIALEKFAQTSENKCTIKKRLIKETSNPLINLEKWVNSYDFAWRQVGFCARWCLDNLFVVEDRNYSYQNVNLENINVMLNKNDVSQYLKIGPDGLEARCDSYSFESVRCTYQVDSGCWYYETLIITPGVMQIGWATKRSHFMNHDGYGIGDDPVSIAYDGCRCLIWYNAKADKRTTSCWKPGDILGCILDLDNLKSVFYINGKFVGECNAIFDIVQTGFFAAASFMSFQQCKFNFGSEPFKYPPLHWAFCTFNEIAVLPEEKKVIIPKHLYFAAELRDMSISEDSCNLCFDNIANMILEPCKHRGFCKVCTDQLSECPMCRAMIIRAHEVEEGAVGGDIYSDKGKTSLNGESSAKGKGISSKEDSACVE